MKNILIKGLFASFLFTLSIHPASAVCSSTQTMRIDSFSSKTTCVGDKSKTTYYLGNLEITSKNYSEQIKIYQEQHAACTYTSSGGMQKTKNSRTIAKVCIQGQQPSKYLIDSREVTFQEYVLAFFADFFDYYPDKMSTTSNDTVNIGSRQVAVPSCTRLTKPLTRGSENSEVLKLQQFLFDKGYLTVKPNGYFGRGTTDALKKFQSENGLSSVGSVGPSTRTKIKEMSCASGVAVSAVNVEQNQVKTGKEKTILDMNKQGYESVPFVVNDNVSLPEEKSKTYEMLPEQAKDYSGILFVSNNVADGMRGYKFRVDINSVQKEGVGGIGLVKISCDPGAELYMVYTGNLCGATSRIDLAGTGFTFSNTRGGGVLNFAVKGKGKIYFEFVVSLPASESSATGKSKVLLYKGVTFDAKE